MPATELLPIDIASLTDGMGTPIVALAKLLAVSNFYRDVLGYDPLAMTIRQWQSLQMIIEEVRIRIMPQQVMGEARFSREFLLEQPARRQ